ncbi:MAG: STAS domain-containing protein [candidate division NC10 bacterium]|nr:STAS domain-containing protein [candidate division NC10 bacterium]MDE2320992.1 STAS domain-containing protein [candidate division NC10 bacterium]
MQLDQRRAGEALIVTPLEERLDARVATDFKERMTELIASGNTKIVLNLSGVEFIDSSGLGAIVSSLKRMGGRGELVVCGLQETTMTLFKLTRMDRVFQVFSNEKQAMSALGGDKG